MARAVIPGNWMVRGYGTVIPVELISLSVDEEFAPHRPFRRACVTDLAALVSGGLVGALRR